MSNGYLNNRSNIENARETDGKFGRQLHGESATGLAPVDQFNLSDGEGDSYTEYADGVVLEDLYIQNDDGSYVARSEKVLWDPAGLLADSTGVNHATAEWTLEAESTKVKDFLEKHYDASLNVDDEGQYRLEFSVDLTEDELSPELASEAVRNRTAIAAAHNEQDHGTFGSDNLGRLLADAIGLQSARYSA